MIHDYGLAGPEIFLAIASMVLLMVGVFSRSASAVRITCWLAVLSMIVALVLVVSSPQDGVTFAGMFVSDAFARFVKVLILAGSAVSIIMSMSFIEREQMNRFEYPVLITIATLGMMMMVSASDLISLYLALELQSLPLYVLAAFRRDSVRATEAGLKYFVLGALSSGMLLYGCSMIYGFTGSTGFEGIAAALQGSERAGLGLIIGIVFLSAGLAFKVSAVPFHMWTPDVYEGAPTPVTAFFAAAPKVAALALFMRAFLEPFGGLEADWRQIIWFISVLSMVLGAFAAIGQTNIKRLMAYSSIGHVGYALIGLAAATPEGVRGVLIYVAIYLVMNLGTFACILAMRRGEHMVEGLDDLKGLAKTHPGMALALAVFMFSLAGIPPLAGFFGKFYVFMSAVNAGLYVLAVIGVVSSVVGAFYYLRIIKLMYFDEAQEPLSRGYGRDLGLIMGVSAVLIVAFVIVPSWLVDSAGAAARALFG
ncbi:NADH-quinone oxidoreductase subunit NuoN [Minwuia thermotolerans]|uniref:NADH-quinone oxidoreductase subunit N n=1 Tax=Minwuia thermotolerans TaxID=2056226 RepID=A0A2M9G1P6_9PROT|nr:NADH-quinone oxidoreductase subunit NuoN [Minwuia thermotolerans]PJK29642.1 NADH-quinone oxidoreductase subunit NuoN [Minwuia thermotolerans]